MSRYRAGRALWAIIDWFWAGFLVVILWREGAELSSPTTWLAAGLFAVYAALACQETAAFVRAGIHK